MRSNGEIITSWILKTTRDEVEYIRVMAGKSGTSTINFDVNLEDFKIGDDRSFTVLDGVRILTKMLVSNQGIRRQLNMMRLMMASGFELVMYSILTITPSMVV